MEHVRGELGDGRQRQYRQPVSTVPAAGAVAWAAMAGEATPVAEVVAAVARGTGEDSGSDHGAGGGGTISTNTSGDGGYRCGGAGGDANSLIPFTGEDGHDGCAGGGGRRRSRRAIRRRAAVC